ncbi:glucose-1-phosphate thymidylyltransferase RfbA [Candidatus Saccharibacteria bacterium]|nr:glucose-1-phosphate thymidylyltransferase RfbA [Candidatus Saccharibacteria bacterium]
MKGIILAGGSGTRLYPITKGISKQLIPIYDKPMVYYPLSTLLEAGISDILIISTPEDTPNFKKLLGDGSQFGINLSYAIQSEPRGLAQAYTIGEEFIGKDKVAMILGDNIFHGHQLGKSLRQCTDPIGGIIFGAKVHDPERYGVVEFDENNKVLSIEEKPETPKSNFAIPGLYFFDNSCIEYAKQAKPSARGEIEITELHNAYLSAGRLKVQTFDEGDVWLDTGTIDSLSDATDYVRVLQKRTGQIVGSPEEVAYRQGFINRKQLRKLAEPLKKSGYGEYLIGLVE